MVKIHPVNREVALAMRKSHFILYVKDQEKSTAFYTRVLGQGPSLHVPGMTEFQVAENCILGLMPQTGIKRLLGARLPDPESDRALARAELYLLVEEPQAYHQRALDAGALELSELAAWDWGDRVAYSLDPDGYVLAFAERIDISK
jgi:catechol 2,3-dioxygenase-like lactoylglutathione lyase family enzyme